MRVPHNSLIAVADGRKLLFLRNAGDAEKPGLRTEQVGHCRIVGGAEIRDRLAGTRGGVNQRARNCRAHLGLQLVAGIPGQMNGPSRTAVAGAAPVP